MVGLKVMQLPFLLESELLELDNNSQAISDADTVSVIIRFLDDVFVRLILLNILSQSALECGNDRTDKKNLGKFFIRNYFVMFISTYII